MGEVIPFPKRKKDPIRIEYFIMNLALLLPALNSEQGETSKNGGKSNA